ncbi:MAG TPA: hypothetical protein VIP70_05975 [Nitrososphaeraceae archaeon]
MVCLPPAILKPPKEMLDPYKVVVPHSNPYTFRIMFLALYFGIQKLYELLLVFEIAEFYIYT